MMLPKLYNTTEAGKMLGCDQRTVSRWLEKLKAEKVHRRWIITDEVIEKIREARAKTLPRPKPKASPRPKPKAKTKALVTESRRAELRSKMAQLIWDREGKQ
jgi:hypothetical protein